MSAEMVVEECLIAFTTGVCPRCAVPLVEVLNVDDPGEWELVCPGCAGRWGGWGEL